MNDLSVIHSQNLQATRESEVRKLAGQHNVVAYEKVSGIVSIGGIKTFDSVAEARSYFSANNLVNWTIISRKERV